MTNPEDAGRRDGLMDDGFVETGTGAADGDRMDVEEIAVIATAVIEDCHQKEMSPESWPGWPLRLWDRRSSAGFFPITAQRRNLITQALGALNVTAGEGHCQRKFQLLQLMFSLSGR
jgi:hypothetical protein